MPRRANINQVQLSPEEEVQLEDMTRKGILKARVFKRVQMLLLSHRGKSDAEICEILHVSNPTLKRIRKEFVQEGLDAALYDAPRSGRPGIYTGVDKAKITALACTEAPEGHARWTIRLLADRAVQLEIVDTMSPTTVHNILKKTRFRRTSSASGVSQN